MLKMATSVFSVATVFHISGNRITPDESRAVPASGYHPSKGVFAVWSPRHRQDTAGKSRRITARGKLPQGQ